MMTRLVRKRGVSAARDLGVHEYVIRKWVKQFDAADAAFATLRIWRDADGDAVTDQAELQTLVEAGITSISLTTSAPAVAV